MTFKKIGIIAIIFLVLILLTYLIFGGNPKEQANTQSSTNSISDEEKRDNDKEIEILKTMTEKERIKRYVSNYMMNIEGKQYERAYNLLYPEFKQNYFPTIEKYTEYVKERYPSTIILSYSNMERQGHYFILYVNVIDPLVQKDYISQKFIVYENDYNNYIISFEVI